MMANEVSFIYRLPLTYVRVTGTRSEVLDALADKTSVTCKAVVTTETAADLLTSCRASMTAESLSTQKTTWNLTSDGRLLGADVATTAEPLAAWTASLSAAAAVVGAGSPLLAAGPPGWAALGLAAGIAGTATHLYVHGFDALDHDEPSKEEIPPPPAPPEDASPSDWGIHPRYVSEHAARAAALANYRATLSEAATNHALAARASVRAKGAGDQEYWVKQIEYFERLLKMTSLGSALAEADYETWKKEKLTTSSLDVDRWLRIDDLPTAEELQVWAKAASPATNSWTEVANSLRIAVSVTLEETVGDNQKLRREEIQPLASDEKLQYRPPRAATLEVWKLIPESSGGYKLQRTDVRRISAAYPGNETVLNIAGDRKTKSAVAATFDATGALTKVTTEIKDPTLQRAHDAAALMPALSAAADAGNGLRKAFSPPSLVERAAEAKAARELGLTASPPDALADLKTQLAEEKLRAQLKIAQQIASSSSLPVFVTISE